MDMTIFCGSWEVQKIVHFDALQNGHQRTRSSEHVLWIGLSAWYVNYCVYSTG